MDQSKPPREPRRYGGSAQYGYASNYGGYSQGGGGAVMVMAGTVAMVDTGKPPCSVPCRTTC